MLAGLVLGATFWWIDWHPAGFGRAAMYGFFGLWLGYILVVDAAVEALSGTSLIKRSRKRFFGLFVASIPTWWLFEYFNRFLRNWEYIGGRDLSPLEYALAASLSFSTVIPAVLESAELVSELANRATRRPSGASGPARGTTGDAAPAAASVAPGVPPRVLAASVVAGLVIAGGITVHPRLFYPGAWLCVIAVADPLNYLLGWPSLLEHAFRRRTRPLVALAFGALMCGFFWEMWNFRSFPKWVYHIPYFGRFEPLAMPHLFEMPLPGYLGYLPFGLEVFALYVLITGIAGRLDPGYVRLGPS